VRRSLIGAVAATVARFRASLTGWLLNAWRLKRAAAMADCGMKNTFVTGQCQVTTIVH
jgi:hypothetical protein